MAQPIITESSLRALDAPLRDEVVGVFNAPALRSSQVYDACAQLAERRDDWDAMIASLLSGRQDGQMLWWWATAAPRSEVILSPSLTGIVQSIFLEAPGAHAPPVHHIVLLESWGFISRVRHVRPISPTIEQWALREFSAVLRRVQLAHPALLRAYRWRFAQLHAGAGTSARTSAEEVLYDALGALRTEWALEQEPWHVLDISAEAQREIMIEQLLMAGLALFEASTYPGIWSLVRRLAFALMIHQLLHRDERLDASDLLLIAEQAYDDLCERLQQALWS